MKYAKNYDIKKRKDLASVKLTREEWAEVLLWLGPQDGNDAIYAKIDKQAKIFEDGDVKEE